MIVCLKTSEFPLQLKHTTRVQKKKTQRTSGLQAQPGKPARTNLAKAS